MFAIQSLVWLALGGLLQLFGFGKRTFPDMLLHQELVRCLQLEVQNDRFGANDVLFCSV